MSIKKVLVTGSSGFLGSHVADVLTHNGHDVVLFDSSPSKFKSKNQKEIIGDILNENDVSNAMEGCDMVYHFAAQADINLSSSSPKQTIHRNIIGTQNVLEAAKDNLLKRVLFASTIYVYSNLGSFYRVSKQACEKMIEEYYNQYKLNFTILRYGSLYGPRSNKFNFISNALYTAITDKKIMRRGDGNEIREYIHVKDAAKLSVDCIDDKYTNQHLIITGNQQMRIKDLLFMIKEIFNGEIDVIFSEEEELHHYEITPYSFRPEVAIKISPKHYHDLGQGLMDLIYELREEIYLKDGNKITLRKRKNAN